MKKSAAQSILDDVLILISSPHLSEAGRRQAIQIAYELGLSDGRVEGFKQSLERVSASLESK